MGAVKGDGDLGMKDGWEEAVVIAVAWAPPLPLYKELHCMAQLKLHEHCSFAWSCWAPHAGGIPAARERGCSTSRVLTGYHREGGWLQHNGARKECV